MDLIVTCQRFAGHSVKVRTFGRLLRLFEPLTTETLDFFLSAHGSGGSGHGGSRRGRSGASSVLEGEIVLLLWHDPTERLPLPSPPPRPCLQCGNEPTPRLMVLAHTHVQSLPPLVLHSPTHKPGPRWARCGRRAALSWASKCPSSRVPTGSCPTRPSPSAPKPSSSLAWVLLPPREATSGHRARWKRGGRKWDGVMEGYGDCGAGRGGQ